MSVTARRKIVYLSGTRADFGLMRNTLRQLALTTDLSIVATGTHLSEAFGYTVDEVRNAGLHICAEVPVDVTTRTGESMAIAIGQCLQGVTFALARERPDVLLLLGDRGEMLAGAVAALHLGIACAHIHGGERSGTVDEPLRHAISKLATWHFVANSESRKRLIRMGEAADRVHITGAPGLDGLLDEASLNAADTALGLGLVDVRPFVLALFHPVVQQSTSAKEQTEALAGALNEIGLPVVWLAPNADAGSLEIEEALKAVPLPAGSRRIGHLPRSVFCSAMRHCAVMVGNSSAGLIEAASFGAPVVNVGDRQRARDRNANVTDVPAQRAAIAIALAGAIAHGRWPCDNRYGDGRAGARIAHLLESLPLHAGLLEKTNTY